MSVDAARRVEFSQQFAAGQQCKKAGDQKVLP
jgi:hypothetical protein